MRSGQFRLMISKELEPKGYFGHGTRSSQTLQSDRPINARIFGWQVRRFLRVPLKELAFVIRTRELLGPRDGEPAFEGLDEQTAANALKTWLFAYYAANGIDCPESLATLERHSVFHWRRVSMDLLLHNLEESFQTRLKVEVYRQVLEDGVALPPLICLRRGWDLLEGYHRLAAHQQAGNTEVPCIVIGRLEDKWRMPNKV